MRSSAILLVLCASLIAQAVSGQSLAIVRKSDREFWIEAVAPSQTRYVLQGSTDLRRWSDLHDAVVDRFSMRLDNTANPGRFFRLSEWKEPAASIRLMLIGDSTASDVNGWGQGLYGFLKPNVQFINYAIPGTSTRLFLRSDEMNNMQALRPDYVLVQIGMMDTTADQTIGTTLEQYAENLRTIVRTIRGFDGVPILITIHAARYWDDFGKVLPTWQDRNAVVTAVADELQVAVVDLYGLTRDLYTRLGSAGSKYLESAYFPGETMHFSPEGAKVIAALVAKALPDSLGPYLTGLPDDVPSP